MGCQIILSGNGIGKLGQQTVPPRACSSSFLRLPFLAAFVIQIIPALQGMITLGAQEQGEAIKEVNGVKLTVSYRNEYNVIITTTLIYVHTFIVTCNLKAWWYILIKQSGRKVPILSRTSRPWLTAASTWGL